MQVHCPLEVATEIHRLMRKTYDILVFVGRSSFSRNVTLSQHESSIAITRYIYTKHSLVHTWSVVCSSGHRIDGISNELPEEMMESRNNYI